MFSWLEFFCGRGGAELIGVLGNASISQFDQAPSGPEDYPGIASHRCEREAWSTSARSGVSCQP